MRQGCIGLWSDERPYFLFEPPPLLLLNYCNVLETINGLSYSQARALSPLTLLISAEESRALLSEHVWTERIRPFCSTFVIPNAIKHVEISVMVGGSRSASQHWAVRMTGKRPERLSPETSSLRSESEMSTCAILWVTVQPTDFKLGGRIAGGTKEVHLVHNLEPFGHRTHSAIIHVEWICELCVSGGGASVLWAACHEHSMDQSCTTVRGK